MGYFDELEIKTPSQQRAKKALADIVESIEVLSQSGDLANLKTRELSARSGYALGTIFHHFKKLDDIFIYVLFTRHKKSISNIAEIINKHPTDEPLRTLASNVLNGFIQELSRPNRKQLLFVMAQFLKRTKNPQLIIMEADVLIPVWIGASQRDKTNTIFKFSENELRSRFRAIQSVVRSPFFEDDVIAGTAEHKEIALDIFMRLFTNPY